MKNYDEKVERLMVMSMACKYIHREPGYKLKSQHYEFGKLGQRTGAFKAEFLNEINGYLRSAFGSIDL